MKEAGEEGCTMVATARAWPKDGDEVFRMKEERYKKEMIEHTYTGCRVVMRQSTLGDGSA